MSKIEIRLYQVMSAGMYEIRALDLGISEDIIFKIGKGEPFNHAYIDAERLAIIINCDLYLNNECIRKRIKSREIMNIE